MQIRTNVNENQVINVSSAARQRAEEREGRKALQQNERKSIFAGDIGLQQDIFTQRKQRAQQKALKIIGDAWGGDKKIDQNVADIRDRAVQLKDEKEENQRIVSEGEMQKDALREQYNVEADSQEQKDLELLEKAADAEAHPFDADRQLTEEEMSRVADLRANGLTEYQERCLGIDDYQRIYEDRNDEINNQIAGCYASIRAIKLERLKYHEMVDAQKNADEVLEAASKESIGLLMDEAKDHVDEELEKPREEAKEKAEEKEEQEEKIEERKEDQEELEERVIEAHDKSEEREKLRREAADRSRKDAELLESMMDVGMGNVGNVSDMQSEIKNMLHKMKLLEEDIKGSTVDDQL